MGYVMIFRLVSPFRLFAAGVFTIALILGGLASGPRAAASDDRLQFTGTTLSGAPFNGAVLQGKPAVLWFWTPWCPFCNAEAPSVSQVAAANPGVTFVGVAAHSDVGAMQSFVSKYNLNFTNLNDADGAIWARYGVPWQPAYVFYRADGSSTFVNNPTSAMSQQDLAGRVAALKS
jgi:thiol-disulfide isomerase/thioredoxin